MIYEYAVKVFKLDEGDRDRPYRDTNGYWTIGRGHLIGTSIYELKLTSRVLEAMFLDDLDQAIADARFCIGASYFDVLADARKLAIISLTFTLGRNKFLKFEETIDHIKAGEWDDAAGHVLAAKWAKDVDPKQRPGEGRDDRVAYMLRTGEFPKEYGI